jgi:hypothetical protein
VEFTPADINPKGEQAYNMVVARFLSATSIGFIPKQIVVELEDEKQTPVITKCELLEASLVPIPSNPDALAVMRDISRADYMRSGVSLAWACRNQHSHKSFEEAESCNAAFDEANEEAQRQLENMAATEGFREEFRKWFEAIHAESTRRTLRRWLDLIKSSALKNEGRSL